ncbi:hypothetical protein ABLB90_01245 [Photorhabdus bodei]
MPLITILIIKYLDVSGVPANIVILYSSVPCASNAYTLWISRCIATARE